jgi:hypothetical protein
MNRVRGMILLFALLAGTGAALAQAACRSSRACCASGTCPLHKDRTGLEGKSHCDGVRGSGCACSIESSATANDILRVRGAIPPAAIMHPRDVMPSPDDSYIAATGSPTRIASGFVSSPELPPQYAGQNNS